MTWKIHLDRPLALIAAIILAAWNAVIWLPAPLVTFAIPLTGLAAIFMTGLFSTAILGARRLTVETTLLTLGLAILWLMGLGLADNFGAPLVGIARPFDSAAIFWAFNGLYAVLAALAVTRQSRRFSRLRGFRFRPGQVVVALVAVVAPVLSALGALELNDGGTGRLALVALITTVAVAAISALAIRRLHPATAMFVLATTTLALLLSVSLRSSFIAGQDMQHEFQVYNLATQLGRWDILGYRDPYNACLSVTILPVMLSNLLGVSGLAVFKVIGQVIFIAAPLTLYVTTRRFVGHGRGFLAALLLVALPTFAIDTPFIVRQEIAFVFVALAFMAAFYRGEGWLGKHRGLMFVIMSLGVTLSHYSTAYLFIGGLIGTYLVVAVISLFPRGRRAVAATPLPRVWIVAVVYLAAFGWLAAATGVSADLQAKVGGALGRAASVATSSTNPLEAVARLASAPKPDPILRYIADTKADPGLSDAVIRDSLKPVSSAEPPTMLSRSVAAATNLDLPAIMRVVYYQVGLGLYAATIGLGLILLSLGRIRRRFGDVPVVMVIWGWVAGALLVVQAALPGLGNDYGLPRALMQSFLILGVPMIVGLSAVTRLAPRSWRAPAQALIVIGLLALYSNLIPGATGGLGRQLALGNAGPYYGSVYPHEADLAAYAWAEANLPAGAKLNMADFAAYYAAHPRTTFDVTQAGIFPWQVSSGNYVLLSKSQTEDGLVYAFGSLQGYEFPRDAYAGSKLLYTRDGVEIYQVQ